MIPSDLHLNARVFHLILGQPFVYEKMFQEMEIFFVSRAIPPSFLSVWILVDKKGSEGCDVGHGGTSAANPILISEEQKARMRKKGLLSGPLTTVSLHHFVLWADAQKE